MMMKGVWHFQMLWKRERPPWLADQILLASDRRLSGSLGEERWDGVL